MTDMKWYGVPVRITYRGMGLFSTFCLRGGGAAPAFRPHTYVDIYVRPLFLQHEHLIGKLLFVFQFLHVRQVDDR